ncbi:ABC transporter permease [Virgibacillus salexigens]|uniref:ABC transporter permease n=1 Tax=Virgibacillus TaxID=84406 RepID=UPI00136D2E16|nr:MULTISPECIES: ABC transporter permease [Virgibacillus]MYL41569.1 ABC transporter permease [Virgibacillus massiliensis]
MHFIKILVLLINRNRVQIQRKWLTLPLLFLFPFIIIGMVFVIIVSFLLPNESQPIQLGLVDNDQSEETQLLLEMMTEASELGSYIQIDSMNENEAVQAVENNQLSSYIIFPEYFTKHLYQGVSVELPVIGNANQPIRSQMINELIESVARHIRSSQANVLTINHYAKEMQLSDQERNALVFEQFKEFVFYTIGRDRIINEEQLINQATNNPLSYFSLAGWFVVLTIWMLLMYMLLYKEERKKMQQRLALYGVSELQQIVAKVITSGLFVFPLAIGLFFIIQPFVQWEIQGLGIWRILLISGMYSIGFLIGLAIIERIIASYRLQLLIQSFYTIAILLLSGAIVPTIYFPQEIQKGLTLVFSSEAFHWLQEIMLTNRSFVDILPLLGMMVASIFILLGFSAIKERLR